MPAIAGWRWLVALPQVKAGRVKAYATTCKNRFAGAPDIPTVAEAGVAGFDVVTWFAIEKWGKVIRAAGITAA